MAKNIILILCVILFSAVLYAGDNLSDANVNVYYFHTSVRCPTCYKLEQYAKETIESDFKDDLSSGKLVFKSIDVDEKENEHFIKEYQLYTKSIVVSLVKGGKEVKWENLDKIWEYVRNKQKYCEYIKEAVSKYLGEVQ